MGSDFDPHLQILSQASLCVPLLMGIPSLLLCLQMPACKLRRGVALFAAQLCEGWSHGEADSARVSAVKFRIDPWA